MNESELHIELIERGLKLYQRFKYQESLSYFEEAYNIAPDCVCVIYNYANVLNMLKKDKESYDLLIRIIETPLKNSQHNCSELRNVRGFIIDAYYLIFQVLVDWKGFSKEALHYAKKHLKLRTRGIKSVFKKRDILREIKTLTVEKKFYNINC